MPSIRKHWVYLIGVGILGLACGVLEGRIANAALFAGAAVYLILLRLLAEKFGK